MASQVVAVQVSMDEALQLKDIASADDLDNLLTAFFKADETWWCDDTQQGVSTYETS